MQVERERLVLKALEQVEPDRPAVLVLHQLDEIPMSEIAPALGFPINTGFSRLRGVHASHDVGCVDDLRRRRS